jgi:tubulin-specific chaperone A
MADDDVRNIFALSSILEEKGIEVIVAENGIEAVDAVKKNSGIDLVLMDVMMPEMDGFEAMKNIRADKKNAKLPIIALTAKAMKGDREKCIQAGANDYLSKPIDVEKLFSMLHVWLYNIG